MIINENTNTNSDQRTNKKPTKYDDYYSGWVHYFIETNEEFHYLKRPRKVWRLPRSHDVNIRYSIISDEHKAALKRTRDRRRKRR